MRQEPQTQTKELLAHTTLSHVYQGLLKAATAPSSGDDKPKLDSADPAPGEAGRNRARQPSPRTHLVVNDAQDQGAAGAGGHVLAVLQILLQQPPGRRQSPTRRLPDPQTPAPGGGGAAA